MHPHPPHAHKQVSHMPIRTPHTHVRGSRGPRSRAPARRGPCPSRAPQAAVACRRRGRSRTRTMIGLAGKLDCVGRGGGRGNRMELKGWAWPGDFCCRLAGGAGVTWCGIQIQSFGQSRTWSSASPLRGPKSSAMFSVCDREPGLRPCRPVRALRPGAVASGGLSGHARGPASATSSPPVTRAFAAARKRPAARRRGAAASGRSAGVPRKEGIGDRRQRP